MHSRTIDFQGDDITLKFGHEGVLYKQSFVMYDKRTNSKWNHSTGLAMTGPLTGTELKTLPSRLMRWSEWKRQHPKTKVLPGQSRGGFMGTFRGDRTPEKMGISVGIGPRTVLYPYNVLMNTKVINDRVGPKPITVVMDPDSKQTLVYVRVVDEKVLTFEAIPSNDTDRVLMRDTQTGSVWDQLSGEAIKGPMKGKKLKTTVGVSWLKSRWRDIYPDGVIYKP